jgi:hypothetical protein
MKKNIFILITIILISLEGCIAPSYQTTGQITPAQQEPVIIAPAITASSSIPDATPEPVKTEKSYLLIDRISENLTLFYDMKWNTLYQADELDCSRMSTYFWDYIRRNFHVAPKIIISYERQHAWLAVKVSDVGNSTDYRHWNIKGMDYYFVEATIPKVVAEDSRKFLINDREYSSAEFYNTAIYLLDTPQDANDFHAEKSSLGGWNQEFRLKADDLDKISRLLGN